MWRAVRAAPGGIDRLELAMAAHLLREEPGASLVFTDGGMVRALPEKLARRLIGDATHRWTGHPDDPGCQRVVTWQAGDDTAFPPALPRWTDRHVSLLDQGRNLLAGWRYPRRDLPAMDMAGTTYLNLSHRNLDKPALHAALVSAAHRLCYIHDDIPLRAPDFTATGGAGPFRRMLEHVGAGGFRIATNSEASRARLEAAGIRIGIVVVPPPMADIFLERRDAAPAGRRYFLLPGLLTARKNIRLICAACHSPRLAPFDIVLAGAPGLDAHALLASLPALPPGIRMLRAAGLSDHAMRALQRGALAVLAPSLEEGFDYPVHEALAAGVPVIASDIPAHREYVSGHAELLDPHDQAAWASALRDYATPGSPRRAAALRAARRFTPAPSRQGLTALLHVARTEFS